MDTPSAPPIDDLLIHGAWLRRLASGLVYEPGEAEDLVQETWLAALVRGPERREEARAWLARVLRNKAANRSRAAGTRVQREQDVAPAESLPSAAVLAGRAEMSRRLVELVLELPSDPQRIVLLRYFEGLSSAEIARRLDRPHGSVRSQLKRGLDQLRQRLDAENEGEREKWLTALAPLLANSARSAGLGAVLATSAGIKVAAGVGLALLASWAWWMNRAPNPGPATPPITASEEMSEPRATDPTLGATQTTLVGEKKDHESALPRVALDEDSTIETSLIQGQVAHPVSGEAVVWYELGIVPAELAAPFSQTVSKGTKVPELEELECVRTDAAGRFVSTRKYAGGQYALVPIEDWRFSQPCMPQFRVRQPRAPKIVEHDPANAIEHKYELETGPVFVIDCPKALELGVESMVLTYSYVDHFPPGFFRPSPMQTDPVPFVRMHTDYSQSHRKKADNLRLVSVDGFWSDDIPMEIPDSIATQYVSFDLKACALVEIDLDYGERDSPFVLELQYWNGALDPEASDAPEPDIIELQAKFDGTDLEEAIVMYVPTGTATIAIKSQTSEFWYRVVQLSKGRNVFKAELLPTEGATGRVEGRVVHIEPHRPEAPVSVWLIGELDDQPLWHTVELEFEEQGGLWVAEFEFTHLVDTSYTLYFDKGGAQTNDPKTFAVEPDRIQVPIDGPQLEFELHTDLTRTKLRVSTRDAVTGEKVKEFSMAVFVPGVWLNSREKSTRTGRATMNLLGDLEGGIVMVAAEGYLRQDATLSQAEVSSKGLKLELDLTPGWGGTVQVRHTEMHTPIAGVSVLVDGVGYGVTDDKGQLHVHVPEAPDRLDFNAHKYELVSQHGLIDSEGDVLPYDPDPKRHFIDVYMQERP